EDEHDNEDETSVHGKPRSLSRIHWEHEPQFYLTKTCGSSGGCGQRASVLDCGVLRRFRWTCGLGVRAAHGERMGFGAEVEPRYCSSQTSFRVVEFFHHAREFLSIGR